jgi:nitronate monooxygenase
VGYRCPAEPDRVFLRKGGSAPLLEGKKCLCNALLSNIGLAQSRESGYIEDSLVTSGDDILTIARFLGSKSSYRAEEVVDWILNGHKKQ